MLFGLGNRLTTVQCVTKLCFYRYCNTAVMRVLNVAEKNDAAKNISFFLSNGSSRRREGHSVYNKIYEFECMVRGQKCKMMMTSVSGHLLNYEFIGAYKKWTGCSPETLFDAPVIKVCSQEFEPIKKTLESEARSCSMLIIWTDCDREGENIGFEIINTCTRINPNLDVFRAKFSEITGPSIKRAIQNLERPNKLISDAVDVRQELDLRIGASFTRFQTLRLQKVFPVLAENLLSYGSCQFPTLGFVVERYLERERFISEPFWKIKVVHEMDGLAVEFKWSRDRVYDEPICQAILARCLENPLARVEKVEGKPKSKWRPTPLDTTEMEKIVSRKMKITPKETLRIAEKLYTQGYISYPRTETNIFPDSINLSSLVEMQTEDNRWGGFARKVLQDGPNPRQGKKSDQSHPPIHPIKYTNSLQGNEARIYEFIVRHFLACVSKDAKGHETTVKIDINTEKFTASGLMILERNYLDVYPYENWSSKCIHNYVEGSTFQPTILDIAEGETSAPNLLTEADLIALMDKHGIGTDATHAEHIETIKTRCYVGLENNLYLIPSAIGMGLVEGYDTMGFAMSKPHLRAELEADLKRICEGTRQADVVLKEQIHKYKVLFQKAKEQVRKIDAAMGKYIQANAIELNSEEDPLRVIMERTTAAMPCSACGMDMVLKKHQETFYLSCTAFPTCKNSIWFPSKVSQASVSDDSCPTCGPRVKMLDMKFAPGTMAPYYPQNYKACVNGCDPNFIEMLGIRLPRPTSGGTQETQRGNNYTQSSSAASANSWPNQSGNSGNSRSNQSQSTSNTWSNQSQHSSSTWSNQSQGSSNSWPNQSDRGNNQQPGKGKKRPRDDGDDGGSPSCLCNIPAKRLTVRKEGPNQGRDFFVCSNDGGDKCSYYAWADEITTIQCYCNLPAKKLTVKKEGPNQGRQFYSCSKPQTDRCSFFQWEDEGAGNTSTYQQNNDQQQRNTGTMFNQQRGNRRPQTQSQFRGRGTNAPTNPRKCGLCSQTGHTRRNCPQNQD